MEGPDPSQSIVMDQRDKWQMSYVLTIFHPKWRVLDLTVRSKIPSVPQPRQKRQW